MIKRAIGFMALLVVFATACEAQNRSVIVAFTNSPTAGVSGYNVYRAPCTGTITGTSCSQSGTFVKLNTAVTGSPYTDPNAVPGQRYSYHVTSVCPTAGCSSGVTGESAPSAHAAVAIPTAQPLPPASITLTIQ